MVCPPLCCEVCSPSYAELTPSSHPTAYPNNFTVHRTPLTSFSGFSFVAGCYPQLCGSRQVQDRRLNISAIGVDEIVQKVMLLVNSDAQANPTAAFEYQNGVHDAIRIIERLRIDS